MLENVCSCMTAMYDRRYNLHKAVPACPMQYKIGCFKEIIIIFMSINFLPSCGNSESSDNLVSVSISQSNSNWEHLTMYTLEKYHEYCLLTAAQNLEFSGEEAAARNCSLDNFRFCAIAACWEQQHMFEGRYMYVYTNNVSALNALIVTKCCCTRKLYFIYVRKILIRIT